jgi:hypothetical protein
VITKDRDGWDLRESGPADADHTVLLLPGGLCTAVFFDDLIAEPKLSEGPIRLVAATPQGTGARHPRRTSPWRTTPDWRGSSLPA